LESVASLLARTSDRLIIDAVERLYEEDAGGGYAKVLMKLRSLDPRPTVMNVRLSREWSLDDTPEPFVDVSGEVMGDATRYAIEFTPWAEWLSMAVFIDNELKPIPDADVIAHVLYEITWGGWTEEDAQETVAELNLAHTEAMDELSSCVDVDKD